MNPEYRAIEYAVSDGAGRITAAAESAARFYMKERDTLLDCIAIGLAHLEKGDISPADRAETQASVRHFQRELTILDAAWSRSSVRRAARELETRSGVESRAAVGASGSFSLDHRSASTGRRTSRLVGYAAVSNEEANIGGAFVEVISAGAFRDVLHGDTTLNYQHDDSLGVLARTPHTLRLSEDTRGLRIEADLLSRDPQSSAIRRRILADILGKMSFAFSDVTDSWEFGKGPGGLDRRRITRIGRLWDVSVVVRPAYEGTSIAVIDSQRSAADEPERLSVADCERINAEFEEWEYQDFLRRYADDQKKSRRAYDEMGRLIRDVARWKDIHA